MTASDIVASLRKRIQEIEGRGVSLDVPTHLPDAPGGKSGQGVVGKGAPKRGPKEGPNEDNESALPLWRLGLADVDDVLPGGALTIGGLHEVVADYPHMPAAGGFCVALLARLLTGLRLSGRSMLLWCVGGREARAFGLPYGPGLLDMGLPPERLIFARAERLADLAWAMEEGVRTPALAGVVGELGPVGLTATRRLLLASRDNGVPGLVLRSSTDHRPSAALTTWRIEAARSSPDCFDILAPGQARWRVTLERCRGYGGGEGRGEPLPTTWNLEWSRETNRFHMAAALADRPVELAEKPGNAGRVRKVARRAG